MKDRATLQKTIAYSPSGTLSHHLKALEIGLEVIDAMKTKIASLAFPKGVGISPVLFHLGPVSDALLSSRYFYRIIDIADL